MTIALMSAIDLESLGDWSRLPSVRESCPTSCPWCSNPTYPVGRPLGVVGHGTYRRLVRGVVPGEDLTTFIRRFLCTACGRTFSAKPIDLLPRRRYAAAAVLAVLVGHLVLGTSAGALAESHGPPTTPQAWRAPARWARQLCETLWAHRAREIAYRPNADRAVMLERLLALTATHARGPMRALEAAARALSAAVRVPT